MAVWTRIANVFRRERIAAEIEEELRSHMEEAVEHGRDPAEVRRAFGSAPLHAEASLYAKLPAWLDALRSDFVFGARMLAKHRGHTVASVLSLALTIGACTAAFRLIDAVLLRPLPVASPERLYILSYEYADQNGRMSHGDIFEYPTFRKLREAAGSSAQLLAVTAAMRGGIRFGANAESEPVQRQYVSGAMFPAFGLRPALGRLLGPADDIKPGGHPYAVVSHEYWTRRFGRDPSVIGRTFGREGIEIVGVAPEGFTGTEPGSFTDVFLPTMMNAAGIEAREWGWFRTWVQLAEGANREEVRAKLAAAFTNDRRERVREWSDIRRERKEAYVNARVTLEPAAAGVSGLQRDYRPALLALGVLVALLLVIACVNVANLMLARTAARGREMALRVSIGAGRGRLIRLVAMESAIAAAMAAALGAAISWWAAPFVASMISPADAPARLVLPADARVLGFVAAVTALAAFVSGIAPALRVSSANPMDAMRGSGAAPRGAWMNALVAAQVAVCFQVTFAGALFASTFDRLRSTPTGFSSDRVLLVETIAEGGRPDSAWENVERRIRETPGVESAAACRWPLMSGTTWIFGMRVSEGKEWDSSPPYLAGVSPGWFETMRLPILSGRDFRPEETSPQVAIVNQAFARRYYGGADPVGRTFHRSRQGAAPATVTIVGLAGDAKYTTLRDPVRPTAYVPFRAIPAKDERPQKDWGWFAVRSVSENPATLAPALRRQVAEAGPGFRVVSFRTQREIVESHTVRERLLAGLSVFFAAVAVVLAGVGLFGVLHYGVRRRTRELGIRLALGARGRDIAASVAAGTFGMLLAGAAAGLAAGIASEHFVRDLLYGVRAIEWAMLAAPCAIVGLAGVLAAAPPVIRAVRVDPGRVLRME